MSELTSEDPYQSCEARPLCSATQDRQEAAQSARSFHHPFGCVGKAAVQSAYRVYQAYMSDDVSGTLTFY